MVQWNLKSTCFMEHPETNQSVRAWKPLYHILLVMVDYDISTLW